MIVPSEATVIASKPAQSVCHGPVKDAAHSTDAVLPGAKLLQINSPFWLNEVTTGASAKAAQTEKSRENSATIGSLSIFKTFDRTGNCSSSLARTAR